MQKRDLITLGIVALVYLPIEFFGVMRLPASGSSVVKRDINAAKFGDKWPLTVDKAILGCAQPGGVFILIEGSETAYAVNGTADTLGYADIEPIWADDPDPLLSKKSMDPLVELGVKLCE